MLGRLFRDLTRRKAASAHAPAQGASSLLAQWMAEAVQLQNRGQFADAELIYRRILASDPGNADAMHLLGHLLTFHGDPREAVELLQRVVERDPASAAAHYNFSLALLASGDLERGWSEYEWRFDQDPASGVPARRDFPFPAWRGEPLDDKAILVWGEQGIGDEILFASLLPDLAARARECVYEGAAKLVPLFARSFPTVRIVARTDPPDSSARHGLDFNIAAGSVARWLRPTLADFPAASAYLVADPRRVAHWRERIGTLGAGIKVGICWRGGNTGGTRSLYYTALAQWRPILAVAGIHFISLQYDECRSELDEARERFGVEVHQFPEVDMFDDLDETAALMKALDLVICAPVTVSVQAAALGIPTWVMCLGGCWQMHGTDRNCWNPAMKWFPVGRSQTWDDVIGQVANALRQAVQAGAASTGSS